MKINPDALTEFREARFLSKKQLAEDAEISLQYLCDLESGRKPGTPPVIGRLVDALRIERPGALLLGGGSANMPGAVVTAKGGTRP